MIIHCQFFICFTHLYKHKILKGGLQPLKLSSITVHYAFIIRMRFHNSLTQLLKKHKLTIIRLRADRIYMCSIQWPHPDAVHEEPARYKQRKFYLFWWQIQRSSVGQVDGCRFKVHCMAAWRGHKILMLQFV